MKLLFVAATLFLSLQLPGQDLSKYWQIVPTAKQDLPLAAKATYRTVKLDIAALQFILKQKSGFISLPLPDGTLQTLQIAETFVMAPALAARYPDIRSFRGVDIPARLDVSPQGFHAMLEQNGRIIYIDPLKNQPGQYLSYYADEIEETVEKHCATLPTNEFFETRDDFIQMRGANVDLRIYRMAIACTGEFVQQAGGTVESALATVASTVNRLNHIYGRDLGVHFQLIANNDELLFTNPQTDPFPTTDQVDDLLSKSTGIFRDSLQLSLEDYDIGHIFVVNCDGANGVALPGGACGNNRAGGVTCFTSANLDAIVTSIFAHEIAHQFGARHTFSTNCNATQVSSGTDVEPFCGHSIMSYNTTDKLPYFHAVSLEQMRKFIQLRSGEAGCGGSVPTTNQYAPALEIKYRNVFEIPKQTPFELTALASDADSLTYSWEQCDAGNAIYRSYLPNDNPVRTFPSLPYLLNGISDTLESLPNAARALTFRCTVRDNHPTAGAIAWKEAKVNVGNNGPFKVLYPNSDTVVWQAGNAVEIRWDVANTRNNTPFVNIKLSINGGYTYPILLAREVTNNGLAIVNLPDVATEQARVRVEAADNIFFNISRHNFTIQSPANPSFIVDAHPRLIDSHCITRPLQFAINIEPIKGFDGLLTLGIAGNLPPGTRYEFSKNQVYPLETTTLKLFFTSSQPEVVNLQIKATAADGMQKTVDLQFFLLGQDISTIELIEPSVEKIYTYDGLFKWTPPLYATGVDFEIATSPVFDSTVVYKLDNISPFRTVQVLRSLPQNRIFYWRVRSVYECGAGKWTVPGVFSTISMCNGYSMERPERVENFTVDYPVQVTDTGMIESVKLWPMQLYLRSNERNPQVLLSPRASLISPSGRKIYLANQYCRVNSTNMFWSFDELAEYTFSCNQLGMRDVWVRPSEPFSDFIGDTVAGEWKLRMECAKSLDSVTLGVFNTTLFLCKNPPPLPLITHLDTLVIRALQERTITSDDLYIQDLYQNAQKILYTLVTTPQQGKISIGNLFLKVGDTFTQQNIDHSAIQYLSESAVATLDSFHFLVQNPANGILPIQPFYIKIEQGTSSAIDEKADSFGIKVFPNPAKAILNIQFTQLPKGALNITLYNIQGQEVLQHGFANAFEIIQINTSHLASGMYFLTVRTEEGMVTKKVNVQQ